MTLFSANTNTIPNAAMKDALIRNRPDRYEIQLTEGIHSREKKLLCW